MTFARKDIHDPEVAGFFHCIARCVRRAFLCGFDRLTNTSFEHRQGWIRERLGELVEIFAVDCLAYAVMGNHLHTVIHNRPDLSRNWSNEEVARRWRLLFPFRRKEGGAAEEPTEGEILELTARPELIAAYRIRLSSISWFNRCLNENIARRANAEDECTGRFWEGRFKCQLLEGDAAVIACCAYVDLNRVRAGIAETPEQSDYTSIQDRIRKYLGKPEEARPRLAEFTDLLLTKISDEEYIKLVEATGRVVRNGKASIPRDLEPILQRLDLQSEGWLANAQAQGRLFRRVIAPLPRLKTLAAEKGKSWFQGAKAAKLVFS